MITEETLDDFVHMYVMYVHIYVHSVVVYTESNKGRNKLLTCIYTNSNIMKKVV